MSFRLERPTGKRLYYLVAALGFMGYGLGATPSNIFSSDVAMSLWLCGTAFGFGSAAAIAFLLGNKGSEDYEDKQP